MSDGIAMTRESVEALKKLAESLPDACEDIKKAAEVLDASYEEKKDSLGAHTNQIKEIISCIDEAQKAGSVEIVKLQIGLVKAAAALNAAIEKGLTGQSPTN